MDELNISYSKLESEVKILKDKHQEFEKVIQHLSEALQTMHLNIKRVDSGLERRTALIDAQCNLMQFDGDLHDQYHEVTSVLESDLDTYFISVKTTLNRLPVIVNKIIKITGLAERSYGSFLNDIIKNEDERISELKYIFTTTGKDIDDKINFYRDKHIEHVRKVNNKGIITDQTGVRRLHNNESKETNQFAEETRDNRSTVLKTILPDGTYSYVLHVYSTHEDGHRAVKGEILGHAYDGAIGHFAKYGPHTHRYIHPGLSVPTEGYTSPNSHKAHLKVLQFIHEIVRFLNVRTL